MRCLERGLKFHRRSISPKALATVRPLLRYNLSLFDIGIAEVTFCVQGVSDVLAGCGSTGDNGIIVVDLTLSVA